MKHNKSFCREKYGKKYRELTPEERKEYNQIRKQLERENHPERLENGRCYGREYYYTHREEINKRTKEYYKNNKEKITEYHKIYRNKLRGYAAGENSKIFLKYGKRFKDMTIEEKKQVKRDYATQHYLKKKMV